MLRIHKSLLERDFTMLPNAIARDQRLGAVAVRVLVELLSRPTDWQTNADRMWTEARRHRGDRAEGRRAFREAWTELEEVGYMRRTKRREGSKWITIIDVYDVPQDFGGTASGTSEIGTSEPGTSLLSNDDEVPSTNTEETRPDARVSLNEGTERPSYRQDDLELFIDLIGGPHVELDGTRWSSGTYTTHALYKGYMKIRKVKWPGAYFAKIDEDGGGLELWLLEQGITVLEGIDPWERAKP